MDRKFVDDCIRSINEFRRIHQAAPVSHNAVVSTVAQCWADRMSRTGSLAHNPSASHNGQDTHTHTHTHTRTHARTHARAPV